MKRWEGLVLCPRFPDPNPAKVRLHSLYLGNNFGLIWGGSREKICREVQVSEMLYGPSGNDGQQREPG